MKWFYLVVLLSLVGGVCCEDQIIDFGGFDVYGAIQVFFEKMCHHKDANEPLQSVTVAVEGAKLCFEHLPIKTAKLKYVTGSIESLCLDIAEETFGCFDSLLDVLRECLTPEEKYYPDFLHHSFDSVSRYFCADDAAALDKLFKSNALLKCAVMEYTSLIVCLDEAFIIIHRNPEEMVTKSELCEDLPKITFCLEDHISKQCPNDGNLRDAAVGLLNAFSSPCNN